MARWYDSYPDLGKNLDSLKEMAPSERDKQVKRILKLIKEECPNILNDFVVEFPLDIMRRRWYDKDPYLWLIFNGLSYAEKPFLKKVVKLFEGKKA